MAATVEARGARVWVGGRLCPDPPRRIPGHRALSVGFRTVHLLSFGILLGGHAFDVAPDRLIPWLAVALASGGLLMALELIGTVAWLGMVKGLAVVLKLVLLAAIPLFWEQRLPLLVAVIVVASVAAHMPARFRHRQLVPAFRAPSAGEGRVP